MHWGTQYESCPVSELSSFGGLAETGDDDMSVTMAAPFAAWLAERYGFDKLSCCFGKMDFRQAFGRSFDKVCTKRQNWILSAYAS